MFNDLKWLFFDAGSTLVDETLAYRLRFEDIAAAAGADFDTVLRIAMESYENNGKGDHEAAKALGVPLTVWHSEAERLYPETEAVLSALHGRYRIGVIANQNPGTADRFRAWGILRYVDLLVASAEEGVAKPDPRIFRIALERAGCAPSRSVMIGDRIDNDIVPAKRLGMHTVRVLQGYGRYSTVRCNDEAADLTVDNLKELLTIF